MKERALDILRYALKDIEQDALGENGMKQYAYMYGYLKSAVLSAIEELSK